MPNPNPVQSEKFVQQQFKHPPDLPAEVKLAATPRCVRLPASVDAVYLEIPKKERAAWLRQAVCQAAIDQGLIDKIR